MDQTTPEQPSAASSEPPITPIEYITTATGTDLLMAGPLAQAYSQGLDALYAKKDPVTPTAAENEALAVAAEDEAVDTGMLRRHYIAAKRPLLDQLHKSNLSLFYGVQKGSVKVQHIVDIVERLAQMSDRQRKHSAVIVDTYIRPVPGQMFQKEQCVALEDAQVLDNEPMHAALVQTCKVRGVPVYSSFEEFLENHPNAPDESARFKKLKPSPELGAVIGFDPVTRPQAVNKVWEYIKQHELQDEKNRRTIHADAKLKPVVEKEQVSMFELASAIGKHLTSD